MGRRFLGLMLAGTMLAGVSVTPAHAEPISLSIAAFAATQLGGIVVNAAISVAFSFGASLLKNMFAGTPSKPKPNLAMRLSVATGAVVAQSFLMGEWATAGSMNYRGSWGKEGGTPNAYYVEERVLADLPMPELTGFWYGPQKATILFDEPHATYGWPIKEARVKGKDHMWLKYRDGTQTTADPYLRAKFGNHEEFPYEADMIGRGRAVAIVTRKVPNEDNRDLFPANLEYKFETSGIALYDLSKDGSAGGFGTHRSNDPSTWAPSSNTAVQVYNVLRGIRYGSEWLFGLQSINPARLPASVWIAAINECKRAIGRKGGGTEPQFRTGAEITVDMEAAGVIDELLAGASGRIAEVGGVYKTLFGAPGAAVMSFTDRDIVVTREQGFSPFPRIEQTFNGIRPKFVNPALGWELGDAPARYSPDQMEEDGDRELMADITLKTVKSGSQTQRVVKTAHEEQRRWRRHQLGFAPIFSELEPLDAVSWTSEENGYSNKKFLVTDLEDEPTYLQGASLQEWDPDDYDYDADTEEKPVWSAPIGVTRPPAQVIIGFGVEPDYIYDDAGRTRRPAVRFTWDGEVEDVRRVGFQLRTRIGPESDRKLVFSDGTDRVSDGQAVVAASGIVSGAQLEGRGLYYARGPRATEWTDWLAVDVPDVRLSIQDMDDELRLLTGVLDGEGSLAEQFDRLLVQLDDLAEATLKTGTTGEFARRELKAEQEENRAYFVEQVTVIVDSTQAAVDLTTLLLAEFGGNVGVAATNISTAATEFGALSELVNEVAVDVDGVTANGLFKMTASAGPTGWETKISAKVKATANGATYEAGWYILVNSNGDSLFSAKADRFALLSSGGGVVYTPFEIKDGKITMTSDVEIDGDLTVKNGTITSELFEKNATLDYVITTPGPRQTDGGTIRSATIDVENEGAVHVRCSGYQFRPDLNSGNYGYFWLRLKRSGTVIQEIRYFYDDNFGQPIIIEAVDDPGNGTRTYTCDYVIDTGQGHVDIGSGVLSLIQYKRVS